MKRVLVIEDLSCYGKCSLTVALPIISAFGVECDVLPTSVFSTHTAPYFKNYVMTDLTDAIIPTVSQWKSLGIKFDCIYVGYLCEGRQTQTVMEAIEKIADESALLVVDPAMADNGKMYGGMGEEHVKEMRTLCKRADFITPNFTEAQFLSGVSTKNCVEGAKKIISALKSDGYKNVIITGVEEGNRIGVVAATTTGQTVTHFHEKGRDVHGTGDVFTSAFVGAYMRGNDFEEALRFAESFIADAIKKTRPVENEHYYGVMFEESLKLI